MKIAIYSIACNEQDHVEDWLESCKLADDVIVVDTGSIDYTVGRLHDRGAQVYEIGLQPFRFDVARNTALSLVGRGIDVCISLDFDEKLAEGWRDCIEDQWKEENNNAICSLQHGPTTTFMTGNRIHSRFGWHWRFPAHEGLYNYGIDKHSVLLGLKPFIIHGQAIKDRSQYLDLLQLGVEENPGNKRCLHYYARELYYRARFMEALPWFEMYNKFHGPFNPEEELENTRMLKDCQRICNVAII